MKFKRLSALLLAFLFVFFAGCKQEEQEGQNSTELQSAEESEMSETEKPVYSEECEKLKAEINTFYDKEKPDTGLNMRNILLGLKPECSREISKEYNGRNGETMTDGKIGIGYNNTDWCGFTGAAPIEITFDLGKVETGIGKISFGTLHHVPFGIGAPKYVKIYLSDDGQNFTLVAGQFAPKNIYGNNYDYVFNFSETLRGRYIKFRLVPTNGWCFVGETEVYKYDKEYVPEGTAELVDDYYGKFDVPVVDTPVYFPSADEDYNKEINLIKGKTPVIRAYEGLEKEFAADWYNSLPSKGMLTDGETSKSTLLNDSWFRFTRGMFRDIVFDLGAECAISSFSAGFLYSLPPAIALPTELSVKASANGKDWQTVYFSEHIKPELKDGEDSCIHREKGKFDRTYKARYVMFSFPCPVHIYCDELEVYGTKKIPSSAAELSNFNSLEDGYPDRYITPDDFCGVNSMLLAYHCLPGNKPNSKIDKDAFLDHVGYYDRNGEIKDTFFDSFLFIPYGYYYDESKLYKREAWEYYINEQFEKNYNIDALNQAASEVGKALGRDVKCNVFLTVLYPDVNETDFGDIDGDGKSENFNRLEDRKKAVKWLIDEQIKRYNEGSYENLQFKGFYWFWEAVGENTTDAELIKYTADYIHSRGYKFFWIPYFSAYEYQYWHSMGFDMASMQANYVFNGNGGEKRVYDNAKLTKRYGMCVEHEIEIGDSKEEVMRYKAYLRAGVEKGYDKAVKTFYTGAYPGALHNTRLSDDTFINSVYHDTYLYVKGKYKGGDISVPVCDPKDIQAEVKNSRKNYIDLGIDTDENYILRFSKEPKYGMVGMTEEGKITYDPFNGYVGEDEFKIYLEFNTGNSKEATIKVSVK